MATTVSFNVSSYSIPAVGNRNWGTGVTNFLIAVAGNALSKSGGNFTLTADVNFGANYGIISKYLKSVSTNIAQSGVVRLANNEGIAWRNAANGADVTLKVDASDKLAFGSAAVSEAELGYLSGVSSGVQTQLDGKEGTVAAGTTDQYYRGDKTWQDLATAVAATAAVTANTAKVSADGSINTHSDVDAAAAANGDTLVFNSTTGKWEPGAAATGSGKNYITNPSASGDTSDWSESGSGTLSRTTTAANLPRANTTGSAFQFTSVSANDYAYADFTLDDADTRAANLLAELAAKVADASTWKVQLFGWSDSDRTLDALGNVGDTEIALVDADSNGDWFLAATTAEFTTFWTPNPSLPYMQMRIVDTVGGNEIYWSDTLVGPGDATSGAAVGPTESVTFTGSWTANTTYAAKETRVGEWAHYEVLVSTTGTPTSAALTLTLPSGRTIDTSKLTTTASGTMSLPNSTVSIRDAGTATYVGSVGYATASSVALYYLDDASGGVVNAAAVTQAAPMTWANGDFMVVTFRIPIAEWAGSGTVGLGTNRVFYFSHDGTDIVYGQGGAVCPTSTPSGTAESLDVSAALPGDLSNYSFEVQFRRGGTGPWTRGDATVEGKLRFDGTNYIGADVVNNGSGGMTLTRGKYRNGTSAAWAGLSSGTLWRVVAYASGVVTGYGQATADTYGLVRKVKYQTKFLQQDVTTNVSDMSTTTGNSGFKFTLQQGRTYRISLFGNFTVDDADGAVILSAKDGATTILTVGTGHGANDASAVANGSRVGNSQIYTMTNGSSLTFESSSISAGSEINGNNSTDQTWVRVEDVTDLYEETDEW